MSKHTPGPWRIGRKVPHLVIAGTEGCLICDCALDEITPMEEFRANAKLIAAAPELLAALEYAVRYEVQVVNQENEHRVAGTHFPLPEWVAQAMAAISAAKGE